MPAPITPVALAAATAGPEVDGAALERALDALVLFPAGDGLSGFDGPDAMVVELLDGTAEQLAGDHNPLSEPIPPDMPRLRRDHHGTLMSSTYAGAAAMAMWRWEGFRERFAANAEPAP